MLECREGDDIYSFLLCRSLDLFYGFFVESVLLAVACGDS